ncbi:AraC family transcriptional regulator [Brevibacterium sp. S111]|uniref:AraC family transcriptional regulator n=1 Tax=Brevibacterium sp. S111 TaxID=2483795 RepID=UPI0010821422|nr:AraC family transcriptional regulator [Brevibacterium sp. S111]
MATVLTEARLFERTSLPLTVRDQMAWSPSGPVTAEAVKVVFGVSGWARVDAPNAQVTLDSGTVLVIPAGAECAGFPHGHARTVTFYLQQDYLAAELRWLPRTHPMVHLLDRSVHGATGPEQLRLPGGAMQHLGPHLARVAQLDATGHEEFAMLSTAAQVAEIVGRFAGVTRPPSEGAVRESVLPRREVAAAVALLRRQPDHAWTIDELADQVSLSSSQLTRVFRHQTGLSPSAYLRQVRVDRMAELLVSGSFGVAEAAHAAGWKNPVVASRAFKRRYGTRACLLY